MHIEEIKKLQLDCKQSIEKILTDFEDLHHKCEDEQYHVLYRLYSSQLFWHLKDCYQDLVELHEYASTIGEEV